MRNDQRARKRGKFWLYGPIAFVALIAVVWSIGWFVLRSKAEAMIDAQLAREAARGRQWSCPGRTIGGFPFRFEVACSDLSYRQGWISADLGPAKIVAQVYNPRHVILQAAGPLKASDGVVSVSGTWKEMEASVSGIGRDGFERISLITKQSSFAVSGLPQLGLASASALATGLHIRPTPGTATEARSFDIALNADGVTQPELDAWTSDNEPLQVAAAFTVSGVPFPPGPTAAITLESWRQAGGVFTISQFDTRKGGRQFKLTGELKLDEEHRPEASFKVGQAGFNELMLRAASGGDLRAKFLQPLNPLSKNGAKDTLISLPPVKISGGEVRVIGMRIPAKIAPLY